MRPTIAIISYRRLTSLIQSLHYKPPDPVRLLVVDAILEEALQIAKKMEENGEADVFLSAGGNANLLSSNLKSAFVEIKATAFDILMALKDVKKPSHPIGVVTCRDKIPHLDQISSMLTISIKQCTYRNVHDLERTLDGLLAEGIRTVIGGSLVLEVAQRKGMHGIFIYSTDSVEQALDTAVQIALSKKAEMERAEELRTILDFAYGGIIATDRNGTVTVFNPSAEKIIGIPRQKILGRPIKKFLPTLGIVEVMGSRQPELNQIHSIGEIKIVTNRIPIVVNGEVAGAVATFQDVGTIQEAEEKIRRRLYRKGFLAKASLDDIAGDSEPMLKAKREAFLYAQNDSTLLIVGESGTGKELFAQGIHNASARARRPFVAVNCAALPENLLESELFGYEDGAFTGARKGGKPGLFELAHGGTIFLDEIGEISKHLQSRLLRVLEEHEVLRIGGDRILPVNIRVVAATNKDLWRLVEKGLFREDLYYRLNVLELRLPPLRLRKSDIPLLVRKILSELRGDLKEREIDEISRHPLLVAYDWPGNVRELKNLMERFAALHSRGANFDILLRSLFKKQAAERADRGEVEEIARILKEVHGNKTEAAKRLGISRTTLWRKLRENDPAV